MHDNPCACGHLVNHAPSKDANVEIKAFLWRDILHTVTKDGSPSHLLPNDCRADGAPWFFDVYENETVYFSAEPKERYEEASNAEILQRTPNLAGAALCAKCDIEYNAELYFDYRLSYPYPPWAVDWYKSE